MATTHQKSSFLHDVPVSNRDGNLLWEAGSETDKAIDEIAASILNEDGQLAFAVYGTWGAGKTSFLRLIESTVKEQDPEIIFCRYNASAYQRNPTADESIALEIWTALSRENEDRFTGEAADRLRQYFGGLFGSTTASLHEPTHPIEAMQEFARRTGILINFPELLKEYLKSGGANAGEMKLVLIVDDLDRCRSSFVAEVIDALQRLMTVEHLFVLIGVDRDALLKAIRELYAETMVDLDEHRALEKYIQHSVDLPDLSPQLLNEYIQRTLEKELGQDDEEDKILNTIIAGASYFESGVRVRTPRGIKRSINAIRPALRVKLQQSPNLSEEDRQFTIKEQLLAYNWRPFYQRHFLIAKNNPNSAQYRLLAHLERLCTWYYPPNPKEESVEQQRDQRALFDLQLERVKRREISETTELDIPDQLARLLGQPPFWFYTGQQAKAVENEANTFGPDLDEQFSRYYITSEQADAVGDGRASVEAAAKAYDLVKNNRTRFGRAVAGQLGNLGVNAEKFKVLDLAEAIFRLALEVDPDNAGVMQQFASYIIDNRSDLYAEAEQLLNTLQTEKYAGHRPLRRMRLQTQLAVAQGKDLDPNLVQELANAAQTESNPLELGVILDALTGGGEYKLAFDIFCKSILRFDDVKSRYMIQRLMADALYRRPEAENEFLAMDLYRQILTYPEATEPNELPRIMVAYATVLDKHGYPAEAGCLYYQAYRHPQGRVNPSFLRTYALYLQKASRIDLALLVMDRNDVEEMALAGERRELPAQFSEMEIPHYLSHGETRPLFECLETQF